MKFCIVFALQCVVLFSISMNVRTQAPVDVGPSANLCDLQAKPIVFLNSTFEVRADYFVGFEMGWLKSIKDCEKLEGPKAILYLFDEDFEKQTSKTTYRRFQRRLNNSTRAAVPSSVRGVFRVRVEPYKKANEMDMRYEVQFRILSAIKIE